MSLEKAGEIVAAELVALGETETIAIQCGQHFDLLLRWNRVHNLTRMTEPVRAAVGHYWDSLQAVDAIRQELGGSKISGVWADIGSGAGFPGVLAALREPSVAICLVEPAKKRASFLNDIVRRLSLANVTVECRRVQDMPPVDLVFSRATLPWRDAAPAFEKLNPGGLFAWMTSTEATEHEWRAVATAWGATSSRVETYALGADEHRRLLLAHRDELSR